MIFKRSYFGLLFLFVLSGAAALIYEILWVRQLSQVFGASIQAVTAVLTAFMGGLGIGSWLVGRKVDDLSSRGMIRLYIGLETFIGTYSLFFPLFRNWAEALYIEFYRVWQPSPLVDIGCKFLLSLFLLSWPTICIGATLPVLSRYLIRKRERTSITVAQLYAANTLGGIFGVLSAGYLLLPQIGIRFTNWIAVCLNFFVALSLWLAFLPKQEKGPKSSQKGSSEKNSWSPLQRAVLWAFGLSGISAMLYEVAWSRTLCMILGTTTYAFTTLVAVFLAGISLGSFCYRRLPLRVSPARLFAGLQIIVGVSVILTLPGFEKLPFAYLSLYRRLGTSWIDLQFLHFFLAVLVMIIPTSAMGMILPVVNDLVTHQPDRLGSRLGVAYGWNTFGCMLGAAVGGLILVPILGMQRTIILGATLNFTAAIWVYLLQVDLSPLKRLGVPAILSLMLIASVSLLKPWAPRVINSGTYVYAPRYEKLLQRYAKAVASEKAPHLASWRVWDLAMKQYKLLFYRTGLNATVAVMERDDGVRFLTVNGKTDASTGRRNDLRTQLMIGHLPLLFHKDPEKVLIVGLGSGITAGAVLAHPVKTVDCAEISPAVIEAAKFFAKENHNALADPRLRVIPRDARAFLLTSNKTYGVVISQPSNPWVEGEANLFASEWYQLVKHHLKKGGLFLQWVPSYLMAEEDFKTILNTLSSIFPHLTVWTSGSPGDVILMASKGIPLQVDFQKFLERVETPAIHGEIEMVGLNPELLPLSLQIMMEDDVRQYLYANAQGPLYRNTYDRPISEFSTAHQLVQRERPVHFLACKADRRESLKIFGQEDKGQLVRLLKPYLPM